MEVNKIVVIKRKTPLEELLLRHSTTSQARFYLEAAGHSFDSYKNAHEDYKNGLKKIFEVIPSKIRTQTVDKLDLPTYQFSDKDLVVAVGDDGMFINVAKYVKGQPIISVNPDEERFDGILSSCNSVCFSDILKKVIQDKCNLEELTMVEAILDDGQEIIALNDLFVGRKTHVSAKYNIENNGYNENQSSSGIIVSTGTGSTGWMTSVNIGANAIANGNAKIGDEVPFARDANYVLYAVREPFPSLISGTNLIYGRVTQDDPLKIKSNMPQEGVIFGDGIEKDYLDFTSGRTAVIGPSKKKDLSCKGLKGKI